MIAEPNCYKRRCKHFGGGAEFGGSGEIFQNVICAAYPDGIPEDIQTGKDMHLKRRQDQDNDIVFEPIT